MWRITLSNGVVLRITNGNQAVEIFNNNKGVVIGYEPSEKVRKSA